MAQHFYSNTFALFVAHRPLNTVTLTVDKPVFICSHTLVVSVGIDNSAQHRCVVFMQITSADVEEDGDAFILTLAFKLHEQPRRRRHSDDDELSFNGSDTGYGPRGVSRDLLRSYAIGRHPDSAHNDRRRHSLGMQKLL